ncbi:MULTISPECIES: NAD(P)-dependent oxidoreductase [Nocardia]|uniref:NAD(P)-dependent oxidoreductase n=1 Tax=Nocardia TaxID=1817 RepID=UPI000D68DB88|nr:MULTISPECIES: NAD(P)-dependent oxidoreductase [Nocardia]
MRVGFIGLGSQGGPMARRIIEAGHPTTLWARRPETLAAFADTDATVAQSPAELAAASDLVCLCVVGDADVTQVVEGTEGVLSGLARGGVIAVHSTIHPDTCREIAKIAADQGVQVIDAPVSGGGQAAAEGRLLVMVGGETDTVERCKPIFDSYAGRVVHLGDLGAGQVAKLLNNLLFTANLATAATTFTLGKQLGIDPQRLGEFLSEGTANSFALSTIAPLGGSLEILAAHASGLLRKDVGLIGDLADRAAAERGAVVTAAEATLDLMESLR